MKSSHVHKFNYVRMVKASRIYYQCRCRAMKKRNGQIVMPRKVRPEFYYGFQKLYFAREYYR